MGGVWPFLEVNWSGLTICVLAVGHLCSDLIMHKFFYFGHLAFGFWPFVFWPQRSLIFLHGILSKSLLEN